jgi:putative PIG3 family NAD(P)H quinone oxidoreductase
MRAVVCEGSGGVEVLRWAERPDPQPGPGQLLVEVAASAVNRADVLQRQGHYPPPPGASDVLGLEAAGRVLACGTEVTRHTPGDQVMLLLAGGGQAERVVADARHALPIPAAVGLPDAGGVMEVYLTAYLNLVVLGRLEAGQRVLIQGGSGGVGQAAIQLAAQRGAEVWTTARAAKLERCREVGARVVLDYARDDVAEQARAAGGVHLILDCLGAGALAANLRALAPDGHLVVIGLQQGRRAELDLGRLLAKRLRVTGSTLRALSDDRKATLVERFAGEVWPLLDDGTLRLVVDRRLPLTEVARAHTTVERGEHVGKLILTRP